MQCSPWRHAHQVCALTLLDSEKVTHRQHAANVKNNFFHVPKLNGRSWRSSPCMNAPKKSTAPFGASRKASAHRMLRTAKVTASAMPAPTAFTLILITRRIRREGASKLLSSGFSCRHTRRSKAMLKASVLAAFLAVAALSPAYAAQDLCTDAHMKQMDDMIAKMTDATKQKEATTALDMSKAAVKKGDKAGCMKHMEAAHKAMGM